VLVIDDNRSYNLIELIARQQKHMQLYKQQQDQGFQVQVGYDSH